MRKLLKELKLWFLLKLAPRTARKCGKDIDGDLFTFFGKVYCIDILHNHIQEVQINNAG